MSSVRRLKVGEGDLYRELRLEALRESPASFGSDYADAVVRSPESWIEQADGSAMGRDRATFVIWDEIPVGLAAVYRCENDPSEGELIQMWIAPEKRDGVVAAELLRELLHWASRNGFRSVKAEVVGGNPRALRFYEKHGFMRLGPQVKDPGAATLLIREFENVISVEA